MLHFVASQLPMAPARVLELGKALEQEEQRLIEAGSIQATGFQYVGERP